MRLANNAREANIEQMVEYGTRMRKERDDFRRRMKHAQLLLAAAILDAGGKLTIPADALVLAESRWLRREDLMDGSVCFHTTPGQPEPRNPSNEGGES